MYGIGGFGGMGGFGGGYGGNPQFQNAVGQHFGNMMGGGAAHGMGNQMGYAPGGMPQQNPNYGGDTDMGMSDYMRRMAMDPEGERARTAALRASLGGGMPQPNPNYGQMPAPAPRPMPMPYPVDFSRLLGGGMSQYPGFGGAVQPGGMDFLRGQFGGGFNPQPDGGRVDNPYMQHQSRDGGLLYGGPPQPDGGRVDNPDMQRQYANGDQYHNAKGNLRMRYRNMQPSYQ